jgi:hypothetical protein
MQLPFYRASIKNWNNGNSHCPSYEVHTRPLQVNVGPTWSCFGRRLRQLRSWDQFVQDFSLCDHCDLLITQLTPIVSCINNLFLFTMAGKTGNDPMAGLLSGVSGLDGSLFARPSSMNDMRNRGQQQSPLNVKSPLTSGVPGAAGTQSSPSNLAPSSRSPAGVPLSSFPQNSPESGPNSGKAAPNSVRSSKADPFSMETLSGEAAPRARG